MCNSTIFGEFFYAFTSLGLLFVFFFSFVVIWIGFDGFILARLPFLVGWVGGLVNMHTGAGTSTQVGGCFCM